MSYEEMLSQQFIAFHAAIVDSCDRSNQPQQTDAMALRLRNNAMAMTKLQITLLPLARGADCQAPGTAEPPFEAKHVPKPELLPGPPQALLDPEPASWAEPEPWHIPESVNPEPVANVVESAKDHILSGDALSRFVSRRIDPAESAYQAWQQSLRDAAGDLRRDATQLYGRQASGRRLPDVKSGSF